MPARFPVENCSLYRQQGVYRRRRELTDKKKRLASMLLISGSGFEREHDVAHGHLEPEFRSDGSRLIVVVNGVDLPLMAQYVSKRAGIQRVFSADNSCSHSMVEHTMMKSRDRRYIGQLLL